MNLFGNLKNVAQTALNPLVNIAKKTSNELSN